MSKNEAPTGSTGNYLKTSALYSLEGYRSICNSFKCVVDMEMINTSLKRETAFF